MLPRLISAVTGPWGLVGLLAVGAAFGGWTVYKFDSHRIARRNAVIELRNAEITNLRAAIDSRNAQVAHLGRKTEQLQGDVAAIREDAQVRLQTIDDMQGRFTVERDQLNRDALAARRDTVQCRVELVNALNAIRKAVR